jgi:hypothetical protein
MNQVSIDNQRLPTGYTPRQQSGAFNNSMAQAMAAGDPRYQMKQYDRAGFSRGGAQANQAGIKGAQDMANGIAAAYQGQIDDQQYNAMTDLNSQVSQERFGQALGGLQQQNAYADQMAMLQQMGALFGLLG